MAPKKDKNFAVQGKEGGMGGKYARKALNLSKSELKKAGASKAAAAREVDITQTTRAYGTGKTLGPAGKPLTGTVKMGDGTTAVYKNGVRVRKAAASSPSRGGGNGNGTGNNPSAAEIARKEAAKKLAAQGYGKTNKTPSHLSGTKVGGKKQSNNLKSSSGAAGTPITEYETSTLGIKQRTSTTGLPSNKNGAKPKTFTNKANPTKGTKRSRMGVVEEWNGYKWVPFKKGK